MYSNTDLICQSGSRSRPKKVIPNVSLPTSCHHRDYVEIINSLPDDDKPSFFGLPANIERSSQRIISSQVIGQLKVLMRSDVVAHKFDKEKWSVELSPILNLWKKLNQVRIDRPMDILGDLLRIKKLKKRLRRNNRSIDNSLLHGYLRHLERQPCLCTVERAMIETFFHIYRQLFTGISHCKLIGRLGSIKVIRGTQLLNAEVQALAGSLLKQEVPLEWSATWEGPADPVHWLRALVSKALALGSWVEKCEAKTLLREEIDLSELFHPDTFLNALRQQTARAMKTSIHNLKLCVSWKASINGAKYPVKLGGLQLEGAAFDGNALSENQRDSPSVSSIPVATVAWVDKLLNSITLRGL
ncbi:Cytoplasmic dynein 2 heavy chain 1 [Exaiptasia diaphana]|nr:Cytoplasmic dynein 2 heavy chain 1 [Exaiptasia diaphana]